MVVVTLHRYLSEITHVFHLVLFVLEDLADCHEAYLHCLNSTVDESQFLDETPLMVSRLSSDLDEVWVGWRCWVFGIFRIFSIKKFLKLDLFDSLFVQFIKFFLSIFHFIDGLQHSILGI